MKLEACRIEIVSNKVVTEAAIRAAVEAAVLVAEEEAETSCTNSEPRPQSLIVSL
jgi:hypothetical protein